MINFSILKGWVVSTLTVELQLKVFVTSSPKKHPQSPQEELWKRAAVRSIDCMKGAAGHLWSKIYPPSLLDQWHTTNNKDQSWNKRSPRLTMWTLLDLKGILHKSFYSNLMFWIIIRCDFGWKGPQHLKLKMWHPDYTLVRRQIIVLPGH